MSESAHREKRPKASDLFKRPLSKGEASELERKAAQAKEAAEWLAQFDIK
jgi:hypothetical protein